MNINNHQQLISNLFVILTGVIWFLLLGYRDLVDPDEGRYAEVAREMLVSGDWLTPRLNGFKFFDKPPLQYWGSALSMSIFGTTNAAARVWCSGVGFVGLLWVRYVGNRVYAQHTGDYAYVVLICSLLYLVLGHSNSLDMGVSVFLTIAIGALLLAQHERDIPEHARNWMLLSWAGLAAATLSKGLIGVVLPGAAVCLYSILQRDWALWKHMHFGKGLLLFLAIAAPWFILVSQENPKFAHYFFIHEHFDRFTSDVHERTKPAWYFFVVLVAGSMPWLVSMISGLIKPLTDGRSKQGQFDATLFLWVYALFIFFFFSISHSKLPSYILPMFPPMALLAGRVMSGQQKLKYDAWLMLVFSLIIAILAWRVVGFARDDKPLALFLALRPWLMGAAFLMAIASAFAGLWKGQKLHGVMLAAVFALLSLQTALWGTQSLTSIKSSRLLAEAIQPYANSDINIYSVYRYDQSLPYYLGRELQIMGFKGGEFKFGIQQQPERWIDEMEILPQWLLPTQAIAILPKEIYQQWLEKKIPMHLIYQDSKHIAVLRQ